MKYAQPPKIYWLVILISLGAALFSGCGVKTPATAKQQGPLLVLSKIEPRDVDGKAEIAIAGTGPISQFTSFQLTEPLRLVVDISDADSSKIPAKMKVNIGGAIDITTRQMDNIARLEIALSKDVDTKVYSSGGKLMIEVNKPVAASPVASKGTSTVVSVTTGTVASAATATVTSAGTSTVASKTTTTAPQPEEGMATVVTAVQAYAGKEGVKVVIIGNGPMRPNTFMVAGKKLVVDIPGARSRVRPSVIPVRKGGLDRVRVGQHAAPDPKVRVVLDLTKTMEYTVTPENNTLVIAMGAAPAPAVKTEEKLPQERAALPEPGKKAAVETEGVVPQESATEPSPPVKPVTKERVEPVKKKPEASEAALLSGKFKGRRISLDLQDADLINVMRLFAEVANLNIVLAPDVKGKVTVRMVNIPWDQAMDIILKMNGMGYALEDNVLRIATMGALTKEAEEELRSKEAKKKAEDMVTRIIPINYANASAIQDTIKKSLSPRGDTVIDGRTNTLIVKDIAQNVEEVVSLIKLLDRPNPQVMIEARIVEATLNFSRDLGVQWGGALKADAAHGNPTGLTFPNSVGVTGGPTGGLVPSGNGNYFVNMPAATGAGVGGGSVGFSFGSISKAINLDLVLSALESTGEGKVISSPRISALDNTEAKIEQGLSVPYSTIGITGTPDIKFIDAKLSLVVTPHVTPDNKIFLKIAATKNAPDNSVLGASGQPSIRRNEATTEMLLADGETAVIGGILILDRSQSVTKVPFFGDLPLIGWLFKSKTTAEDKRELIIFITPRIVKQEVI